MVSLGICGLPTELPRKSPDKTPRKCPKQYSVKMNVEEKILCMFAVKKN
jgi:hypothetical protein